VLLSLFNIILISVTINPNIVNFARDVLSLKETEWGRLIALLILANLFLIFFSLYLKEKIETMHLQFDQLVRHLGATNFGKQIDSEKWSEQIMVLIPAYNEAENLKSLLPKIPKTIQGRKVGVLVVDDGSEDGTAGVVRQQNHLVVSNNLNRGQGAASRLGYDLLKKHGASVGVTIDADNQHQPEDLEKIVTPILEGKYDLVIGSRVLGSQRVVDKTRNIGITLFSKAISLAIGQKITDCSSGFKAFNMERLKDLILTEDQFQSAEVLIEARKKGLRITEVPITINPRMFGESKKGSDWRYGVNFLKTVLKTWWR